MPILVNVNPSISAENQINQIETQNANSSSNVDSQKSIQDNSQVAQKNLDKIINQSTDTNVESSQKAVKENIEIINERTDELKGNNDVNQLASGSSQLAIKETGDLPDNLKVLFTISEDLKTKLANFDKIEQKIALLPKVKETINLLVDALKVINQKDDTAPVQIDLIAQHLIELDAKEDSLSAAKELKSKMDELKKLQDNLKSKESRNFYANNFDIHTKELTERDSLKAYSEILDTIKRQEKLAQDEKLALNQHVFDSCKPIIAKEVQNNLTSIFHKAGVDCSQGTIDAATSIVTQIYLANPYRTEPISIEDLFVNFSNSHTLDDLNIKGKISDDKKLVEGFRQALVKLAVVADPNTNTSPKEFCQIIDKFSGFDLDSYAVIGKLLKTSLAYTPELKKYAEAQHTYKVAVKTLLNQLPKKELSLLQGKGLVNAITKDNLSALMNLPNFKDIKNQVAALITLQREMILNGEIDLEDIIKGDEEYDIADLQELEKHRKVIADRQIIKFFKGLGDTSYLNDSLDKTDQIIDWLNTLSNDYILRSLKGEKDEKNVEKYLKKIAGKLTGTRFSFSEYYLTKVYDMNLTNKAARVMDHVHLQLTGENDPARRQMLQMQDKEKLISFLFNKATDSLINALVLDSTKKLEIDNNKVVGSVTLAKLLFDRAGAEGLGFDFNSANDSIEKLTEQEAKAFAVLKGIRSKVLSSLKHEKDFALQNGEAIRLHSEKKLLNAKVRAYQKNYSTLSSCIWRQTTRKKNVEKVIQLNLLKQALDGLDQNDKDYAEINNQVQTLFDEIKDLNLTNFTKHNSKENLTLEQFLEKAVPLAEAIDYMAISKTVEKDLAQIKELKSKRDECRAKLDDYLIEAKKCYGGEVIRHIQRHVMLANYFIDLDNNFAALNFEERCKAVQDFLKKRSPIFMKDCDKGIVDLIIKDTLRLYVAPSGVVTDKYLDKIDEKLGTTHSLLNEVKSLFGKRHLTSYEMKTSQEQLKKSDPVLFEKFKKDAVQMYLQRGSDGLMSMVEKKGQSFIYSKEQSVKISSAPALLAGSISYMPNESFSVTNTGDGYKVLIKSDKAVKIAASLGLIFDPPIPQLGFINAKIEASVTGQKGKGLELTFKEKDDVKGFIKDFMEPNSPLHQGIEYDPPWKKSTDIQTVNNYAISGSIGISAGAAFKTLTGKNFSNQLNFGGADYSKVKDVEDYLETYDYKNHFSQVYQTSIQLPSAKIGLSFEGGYKHHVQSNANITTITTSSTIHADVDAEISPVKIQNTIKPIYTLLETGVLKFIGEDTATELAGLIGKSITNAELNEEQKKLMTENMKLFFDHLKVGETNAAEATLGNLLSHIKGPVLETFANEKSNDWKINILQKIAGFAADNKELFIAHGSSIGIGVQRPGVLDMIGEVKKNLETNSQNAENAQKKARLDGTIGDGKENPHAPTTLEKVKKVADAGGKFASAVQNITLGDPMIALNELINLGFGKQTKTIKGEHTQVDLTAGGEKLAGISIEHNKKKVQVDADISLLGGAKLHTRFGTICNSKHIIQYDHVYHQYLPDSCIDLEVEKKKFTLDNMLEFFNLSPEIGNELANSKPLMTALVQIYGLASPDDTVTMRMQIKPKILERINELESKRAMSPGKSKDFQKEIDALLSDSNSFTPVAFEISHQNVANINLKYEMNNLNLFVFSYSHQRKMTNGEVTTISLKGLDSVQKALGESVNSKTAKSAIKNTAPQFNDDRKNDASQFNDVRNRAAVQNNVADHAQEILNDAKNYVSNHAGDIFTNEEARQALLDKLNSSAKNDSFLQILLQEQNTNKLNSRLQDKYNEYIGEIENTKFFNTKKQESLAKLDEKVSKSNLSLKDREDFKNRLAESINSDTMLSLWNNEQSNLLNPPSYLEWSSDIVLEKLKSDKQIQAVDVKAGPSKTTDNPQPNESIKQGTTFGQHKETCFMMCVANALSSTQKGCDYFKQWLIDNVKSNQSEADYSNFEQTLSEEYGWILGDMGEGDKVAAQMGLISTDFDCHISKDVSDWKLREHWCDVSNALNQNNVVLLFTDNPYKHYRAIVGTYGNPFDENGEFGFIVRDSMTQSDSKISAKDLVPQDSQGHTQINIFSIPQQVEA